MPRPNRMQNAKPKDLVGTWKKLFGYLKKYHAALAIALICAAAGVVCTLQGPGLLSDMTEAVTKGIAPKQEVLEEISTAVSDNLQANMEELGKAMQENAAKAQAAQKAAEEAQKQLAALKAAGMSEAQIAAMQKEASKNAPKMEMPEDIRLNGQTITLEEQQDSAQILAELQKQQQKQEQEQSAKETEKAAEKSAEESKETAVEADEASQDGDEKVSDSMDTAVSSEMLDTFEKLPDSMQKALFSDVKVDGTTISTQDQLDMMEVMSQVQGEDAKAMLEAIDELPASVYELIKPSIDMKEVTRIGLLLAALFGIGWLLSLTQGLIMSGITQKASYAMRQDISVKINKLPIAYFEKTSIGDILSRITNDVDTISQSLNQSISTLLTATVMLFGSLYLMVTTNGIMALTAVLASLLGFVLIFVIMGRSQKYFSQMQNSLGRINGHIEEIYTGHTVVKAYNGEEKALRQFDEYNDSMVRSAFKATALSSMMPPLMTFIGNFGYVAICVVGGAMALNGEIGFGTIVAFMMYVRYFTQPLSQIAQAFTSMQSAAAAGERVFAFLEAENMEDESAKTRTLGDVKGEVEFSHIRFRYDSSDHDVIHDFSAKAKPGQKIAIVGPTGAGKTTMVNLLMRFYEVNSGIITIDGINTRDVHRSDVHRQFCMVLQDTWLFEGTMREVLAYNTPDVSDEKIMEAVKAVGLDHLVKTLPHGLDTVLNDQTELSAGQKQQVTIARAMIADRPMLILDEATSSVDTRTEQQIQKAMDQLMENRTSFVIAHRLSTIRDADLILVMNHGDIVESGTHEELLARGGFYARLYNSQFENGQPETEQEAQNGSQNENGSSLQMQPA